jgi:hypothetical protein
VLACVACAYLLLVVLVVLVLRVMLVLCVMLVLPPVSGSRRGTASPVDTRRHILEL